MIPDRLDSSEEIDKISINILAGSKASGKFPTPVDEIISYAELSLERGIDLSVVQQSIFSKSADFFGRVSRKILGMIDLREKVIYLDHSQAEARKNFIKLHEVGHGVLPWQVALLGCRDDETTIVPEIEEIYELEASYFASNCLFQFDRFDEESAKLPLSLASARALSAKFGGSLQATLRRYVERSPKRCAMLVFHRLEPTVPTLAKIRNYFQSTSFSKTYGIIKWPTECGMEFEFVRDMIRGRKWHETGKIQITNVNLEKIELKYHFFNNTYNVFILFIAPGEKTSSKVKFIITDP